MCSRVLETVSGEDGRACALKSPHNRARLLNDRSSKSDLFRPRSLVQKNKKNSLPSAGRASRQLKLWLRRLLAAERAPQLASAHRRHLGHILGWRRNDATFSPKIRKKRRPTRGFERGGERFQPRQLNLYVEYFR